MAAERSCADGEPHWADAYYGELYFDSAADLLTPGMSAFEAQVIARLLDLREGERVLDLACGHGRHAWPLAAMGARVVGLERSARYLARAIGNHDGIASRVAPTWVRGDVRALPLGRGTFDGAFSWYSSLFMFDDETNLACLRGLTQVVRPGGRILVHHANPVTLAGTPVATARRVLADGSLVEEESRWLAERGVDQCARKLTRPDGTVLSGTAELRYYSPREWGPLAAAAGAELVELTSSAPGPGASATTALAPDLVAVLRARG